MSRPTSRRNKYDMVLALRDAAWGITAAEATTYGGQSAAAIHVRTESVT